MHRPSFLLAMLVLLTGCAHGACCRSSSEPLVVAPAPAAAPSPDLDEATRLALEGARTAWTDEITAGNRRAAECLFQAGHEPDPAVRERKRNACIEQFKASMRANDEAYEQAKAVILGRSASRAGTPAPSGR